MTNYSVSASRRTDASRASQIFASDARCATRADLRLHPLARRLETAVVPAPRSGGASRRSKTQLDDGRKFAPFERRHDESNRVASLAADLLPHGVSRARLEPRSLARGLYRVIDPLPHE
jgi:hypothetical protein